MISFSILYRNSITKTFIYENFKKYWCKIIVVGVIASFKEQIFMWSVQKTILWYSAVSGKYMHNNDALLLDRDIPVIFTTLAVFQGDLYIL